MTAAAYGSTREQGQPPSDLDDPVLLAWLDEACAAVGVDPALVDVSAVHRLTAAVSARVARPMAPVSALVLGLAVGAGRPVDAAAGDVTGTLPTAG